MLDMSVYNYIGADMLMHRVNKKRRSVCGHHLGKSVSGYADLAFQLRYLVLKSLGIRQNQIGESLGVVKSYKVVPGKVSQSRTGLKAK